MGWKISLFIIVLAIVITFNVFLFAAVKMPADIRYSNEYGSAVTMTYDAADLEGIRYEVMGIWSKMNATWPESVWNSTWNSPWPWDHIKENSLFYQNRYFGQLIHRIDNNIVVLNSLKANSTNPVLIDDWQDKVINKTRIEMKSAGGLVWVIEGAWYLTFEPMAYWAGLYALISFIALVLIGLILAIIAFLNDEL